MTQITKLANNTIEWEYKYNCKHFFQDIKNNGGPGYKYITVEEDEAANVVYCNNTLVHLSNEQIPKGFAVS